jgi:hypothetical protein
VSWVSNLVASGRLLRSVPRHCNAANPPTLHQVRDRIEELGSFSTASTWSEARQHHYSHGERDWQPREILLHTPAALV